MEFPELVRAAAAVEPKDRETALGKAFTDAILAKMQRRQIEDMKARLSTRA